jgi:abortive infection bacteriophage resistance protein
MVKFTKPYLTVEQQIAKLKDKGMVIDDLAFAEECLKNIGYYRLSGYWYPMLKYNVELNENNKKEYTKLEEFQKGVSFEDVINIYSYDKKLRILLLNVLESIETTIKTDFALELGQYNPWSYRDSNYFSTKFVTARGEEKSQFTKFVENFDSKTVANSKTDFVKHFKNKYSDPLPIWAAVELWDFGTVATLLSGLKTQYQMNIAERYDLSKPDLLTSGVSSLAYIRNVCAHHSRLWNKPPVFQPRIPTDVALLSHLSEDRYSQQRLYSTIAVARYMQLKTNSNSTWAQKLIGLNSSFPESKGILFKYTGFPEKWTELDLWK